MMAHVVADTEFRGAVADALDALDRSDHAAAVTDWVASGKAPHDEEPPEDWTDRCLSHALGSNVRQFQGQEDGADSGAPTPSGANGEDASAGDSGRGDEVLAKTDPTGDGPDQPEEYRT